MVLPAISRLRELLKFDPQTGEICWIAERNNGVSVGDVAGHKRREGYRYVHVDGRSYGAHRIAWALHHGEWSKQRLDHINRNPSDNRIINLRQVTHAQNIANSQSKRPGRLKGAYWHSQRQCWHSNITINGKKRHLGLFQTEADAAAEFERMSREVYGEYARVEAKQCGL